MVLGLSPASVAEGLGRPVTIPGWFERIHRGQPFDVIVDFAHTPDGLDHLLAAVGKGSRRVLWRSGAEAIANVSKRSPMGAAAARGADVVVITADNSRPCADRRHRGRDRARGAIAEPRRRARPDLRVIEDRRGAIPPRCSPPPVRVTSWSWPGRATRPRRRWGRPSRRSTTAPWSPREFRRTWVHRSVDGRRVVIRLLIGAGVALAIAIIGTKALIEFLVRNRIGQPIREDGPQGHFTKAGTPTMGGVAIVGAATGGTWSATSTTGMTPGPGSS